MAKKKKKHGPASQDKKKNKFTFRKLLAVAITAAIVSIAVVFIVITARRENAKFVLRNTYWVSQSAKDASGDEVDIHEVYNVRYSQYQGSLTFDGDNRFQLWLSPGDATDGTHSGTYEVTSDSQADVQYDDGTAAVFHLIRSDGKVTAIELNYRDYIVSFTEKKPDGQ